jgi:hypothetical protein
VEFNGGYNTGTQLVEAVLAFLRSVSRTQNAALQACAGTVMTPSQQAAHSAAMQEVIQRIFGDGASMQPVSATQDEDDTVPASQRDCLSPLDLFRRAQLKYSLTRFFTPHQIGSSQLSESFARVAVFDPGFHVMMKDAADSEAMEDDATSSVPTGTLDSTAILLPRPLLRLYRAALFSPVLLSILLTHQFVGHVSVGDVVHPCVFHTQTVSGGAACAHADWERQSDECWCVSSMECVSGVRLRLYQMLFTDMNVRPRALPHATASSIIGSAVSSLFSSLSRGVTSLFRGGDAAAVKDDAEAAVVTAGEIVIWEFVAVARPLSSASQSDDPDDSMRWNKVVVHPPASGSDFSAAVSGIVSSWAACTDWQPPSLFPELDLDARRSVGWCRFFWLMDVVPDLQVANEDKLGTLADRLNIIRVAAQPLIQVSPHLCSIAMVFRSVFLHSLRGLLVRRFEPAAIGESLESAVQAQLQRAIVGINAMLLQLAMHSGDTGERETQPTYLSLEAMSLSQLFMESYHWCEYALQTVRLHAHLQAELDGVECTNPTLDLLLPLHLAFSGSTFHQVYVQLLSALHTSDPTSKGQKKRHRAAAPSASAAASSDRSTPGATKRLPSSSTHYALISPALSNALLEVDASLHERALKLLGESKLVSAGMAPWVTSSFLALKRFVFCSMGLPVAWPTSAPASTSNSDATPHPAPCFSILERPTLPYETCRPSLTFAAPSLRSSTFFSLCCSPSAAAALNALQSDDSAAPAHIAQCDCGVSGIEIQQLQEQEEALSDEASEEGWTPAAKSKRRKKGKGKGRAKR